MQARVGIGAQALFGAYNDDRETSDVINEPVAHFGNVLLAAGELPDALPHPLHLEVKKGGIGVVRERNIAQVLVGVGLAREHRWQIAIAAGDVGPCRAGILLAHHFLNVVHEALPLQNLAHCRLDAALVLL